MRILQSSSFGAMLSAAGLFVLAAATTGCPTTTAPTLTSFAPATGNPGIAVTILGTGLDQATGVTFNGEAATYYIESPSQITAFAPDTSGPVTVAYSGGTVTAGMSFTATHLAPVIASVLSPTLSGSPGSAVVLEGQNFTGVSAVSFCGASATYSIDSDSQLSIIVPTTNEVSGGITVTNPYGNGYQNFAPVFLDVGNLPVIFQIAPMTAAPGTTLTVTGQNFYASNNEPGNIARVRFGSLSAQATVTDNLHLSVTVPAGVGDGPLTVENNYGQASSGANFHAAGYLPAIARLTPAFGPVGTVVTITGNRLLGSSIAFNGVAATPTSVTATAVTVAVPAGATSGSVTVSTPHGAATSPQAFTVASAPTGKPVVSSFFPALGTPGSWVTVTGSGFAGATSVLFGGYAGQFIVDSDTQLTALVPQGPSPTGELGVVSPAGTGYSSSIFAGVLYSPAEAPMIYSMTPVSAAVGATVTLTGWGFTDVNFVRVGGVPAAFSTAGGSQLMTFTVPAGAVTGPVFVATPMGNVSSGIDLIVQ